MYYLYIFVILSNQFNKFFKLIFIPYQIYIVNYEWNLHIIINILINAYFIF